MSNICFFGKLTTAGSDRVNSPDVIITTNKDGRGWKSLRFSFTEKALRMIADKVDYVMCGLDDEHASRIYFMKSDKKNGYKVINSNRGSLSGKKYFVGASISRNYEDPDLCCGDYMLHYSPENQLMYIDLSERKEDKK